MGLKVVRNKNQKKKPMKIVFGTPFGVDNFMDMAQDDADILIKYKAIKADPVRFENAKMAMKTRGY